MCGTWNLWWPFHWVQLRAAAVQRPWAEAKGTLPKVPMPWHPPVLVIAVRDEWWEDWESGTYPIHSGMSRVFYLPQHRTLSTRHPLALHRMRSTGCWVSADQRRYWKSRAPHNKIHNSRFSSIYQPYFELCQLLLYKQFKWILSQLLNFFLCLGPPFCRGTEVRANVTYWIIRPWEQARLHG